MLTLNEKKDMILEKERVFAQAVSAVVIDKPTLSLWMILIPVIFVHFFYRLNKYSQGRKEFAQHFVLTKEKALDETLEALETDRKPDANKLAQAADIPKGTSKTYQAWMKVLFDHYRDLLESEGDTYETMVRAVYKNKTNYLLFLNSLSEAEKAFDRELKPHLEAETNGVNGIVKKIESCSTELRRQEAATIFS
jgi:hypothetical protein